MVASDRGNLAKDEVLLGLFNITRSMHHSVQLNRGLLHILRYAAGKMGSKGQPHDANGESKNADFIRAAIDKSNMNALRLALLQLTGDEELAKMKTKKHAIRGGAMFAHVLAEADVPLLKEKAFRYLSTRKPGDAVAKPPSPARARELADMFGDEPVSERDWEYNREELAFDEFPRASAWTNGKPPSRERLDKFKIIIVGGGISGIAAAVQFQRLGLRFEVIERQNGIGGTWLLNSYPDARVDTSSYLFQFKFVKNYPWTEYFASAGETRNYLEHVADLYGIRDKFALNREVVKAQWDEATSEWVLTVKHRDGMVEQTRCNAVVSASGLFATPLIPDIRGVEKFKGAVFHTAKWDHTVDYSGKRVALLGTGSTGTQLAPSVSRKAKDFSVYQRTPNWIMKMDGYRDLIDDKSRYLFDNMPYYWNWFCYSAHVASQQLQYLQTYDTAWQAAGGQTNERNDITRRNLTEYVTSKLANKPEILPKVLPQYAPLIRRLVVDNGFYDMLLQPHVEVVTDRIERFTERGILTDDGVEREFDVVIFGTGFQVSRYHWPCEYVGRGGATMYELWKKDGPRSYLGLVVPGFPNFFTFYGPNHQPRSGGFYSWAEIWSRYTADAIIHLLENNKASMECRKDVFDEYNARLDEAAKGLIWELEGRGYYVNEHGRQSVNAPWYTADYHRMVMKPNLNDFEVR